MNILITGGAGFIGSAVVRLAISRGHSVVNLDALTYAATLESLASISDHPNYLFVKMNIRDRESLDAIFSKHKPLLQPFDIYLRTFNNKVRNYSSLFNHFSNIFISK